MINHVGLVVESIAKCGGIKVKFSGSCLVGPISGVQNKQAKKTNFHFCVCCNLGEQALPLLHSAEVCICT